jgi:colanic acid/amylovoran biosynthesis glycosyltransferase
MSHFVKKEGFAHIHAYWATYPAACAQVISQLSGVPFSFTGHAHDIYVNTVGLSQKVERASFVSTCTHQNKAYLSEFTPTHDSSKIFVNYHGLNLERFAVNSASRPDRFEILSVGTLQGHKGFPYLVEALGELKKKRVEFHCTIVGGGPLENQLRNQIRNLELKHEVTMTGALKQSDVIPYYKKADLLILMAQPEWHWGIPNVLIEALAAQTVVLTTRFGSVEELVEHEKTGILVPSKNPLIVAEHINRLARDEQLRARLARAGHEKVKANFDLEKNIVVFSEKLTGKVDEKSATRVA